MIGSVRFAVFEPLDFLARLAALVPLPRVHLTRYHGVFAPHAPLRSAITPAGRGRGSGSAEAVVDRVPPKHMESLARLVDSDYRAGSIVDT